MPKSLMLTFSSPASPEQEADYNRWYSEKHIREVVANVPGVVGATRYKIEKAVTTGTGSTPHPRDYVAIYELEAETEEDMQAVADALMAALKEGKIDIDSTLDRASLQSSFVRPITDRVS